ncbi:MAG: SPOR domain-containing protein [Rhodothermales bacterium]|nr:SPOR domain-containing protein [Rhodothermales bacterium]MBO6781504.1 SPOR domain-containing protein [Rhodothermales bacterium]
MRTLLLSLVLFFSAFDAAATTFEAPERCSIEHAEPPRNGFTIQVASTSNHSNARQMVSELPGSWISVACVKGAEVYRINFGRFQARNHAVAGQWDLEDLNPSLSGQIVRF